MTGCLICCAFKRPSQPPAFSTQTHSKSPRRQVIQDRRCAQYRAKSAEDSVRPVNIFSGSQKTGLYMFSYCWWKESCIILEHLKDKWWDKTIPLKIHMLNPKSWSFGINELSFNKIRVIFRFQLWIFQPKIATKPMGNLQGKSPALRGWNPLIRQALKRGAHWGGSRRFSWCLSGGCF